MVHLKLGTYSFIIDTDELGLEPNTSKTFTRDELPDNLKPLFDIVSENNFPCEKSIFVNIKGFTIASGNLAQQDGYVALVSSDGTNLGISYDVVEKKVEIIVTIF